jgi:hypothetical protein
MALSDFQIPHQQLLVYQVDGFQMGLQQNLQKENTIKNFIVRRFEEHLALQIVLQKEDLIYRSNLLENNLN